MKAAIVVDTGLPLGLIANASAVMGASLGALHPEIIGDSLTDASGQIHPGITGVPIPILSAEPDRIRELVRLGDEDEAVTITGFTDVAQRCKNYDDYRAQLAGATFDSLRFLAVLVTGSNRAVARLTGSLPLAR